MNQSVTFLVSKPKCQSQECDIFGFETGFETKMSFSGVNVEEYVECSRALLVGGFSRLNKQGQTPALNSLDGK